MKKTILSTLAMLVSIAMFAIEGETAAFQIDVYVGATNTDNIFLSEAPFYTNEFDNMYDALKAPMGGDTLIYSVVGTDRLAVVARPNLVGTFITFQANEATDYKLAVTAEVPRTGLWILDHKTNKQYKLEQGTEIAFTQDAKTRMNNRFEIIDTETPTDNAFLCHFDDKLIIYDNPYMDNIVITDVTGAEVKSVVPASTPQTIDLSDLTPGNYNVILGNGQKELVINVK